MLYVTTNCGLQLSFWNWLVGVNTKLVSQPVNELIWGFCILVVWSYMGGDELGSANTNSPGGSYCLRCKQKNGRGFVCYVDTNAEQNTYATELSFLPRNAQENIVWVAEVSEKRLFYKCLYIFQTFCVHMYLFIMLLLQNSIY